jgi:hypothetical protein
MELSSAARDVMPMIRNAQKRRKQKDFRRVAVFVVVSAVGVELVEIEEPVPKGKVFVKQNVSGGVGLVVVCGVVVWCGGRLCGRPVGLVEIEEPAPKGKIFVRQNVKWWWWQGW